MPATTLPRALKRERLFSTAKFIFSDLRRSLLPRNLEMQLFLKLNRDLWDFGLVEGSKQEIEEIYQ